MGLVERPRALAKAASQGANLAQAEMHTNPWQHNAIGRATSKISCKVEGANPSAVRSNRAGLIVTPQPKDLRSRPTQPDRRAILDQGP